MMELQRPHPINLLWAQHKATIRRLYIVEEMSLQQLVVKVRGLGLTVTYERSTSFLIEFRLTVFSRKSQLEYKLKQWGFRRNIDKHTWAFIDHAIAKRKREGKESQVIYCGKRLKPSTVERETSRHRDRSILAQLAPGKLSSHCSLFSLTSLSSAESSAHVCDQ